MRKKWVVAGWVVAAAVAVAAGIGAVALAQGGSLAPPTEPMSEESVQAALEEERASASGEPSPESSPRESSGAEGSVSPAPTGQLDEVPDADADTGEEIFSVDGGTFLARCSGEQAELLWWVAAQGWQISSVDREPDDEIEIEFENANDDEIEYNVDCVEGKPRVTAED